MVLARVFFPIPIVLSACLIFLVQPIIAKQILPWFGGVASVWNTCLFFFQFILLIGYLYAHGLMRWFPPKLQATIHIVMLALSCLCLPIAVSATWKNVEGDPALRILLLLSTTVGLPYFVLASTTPLLQAWYARLSATPYWLFSVSNAASLAGLLGYPFLIERTWNTNQQGIIWSAGFGLFAAACAGIAVFNARNSAISTTVPNPRAEFRPVASNLRALWLVMSALGSLTLVSVTSFVGQNIASVPLIWIIPLSLYLITFILAFAGWRLHGWTIAGPAMALSLAMVLSSQYEVGIAELHGALPLFMAGLFFVCLYCHGELAASKPDPSRLTEFYIMVSLGGALGSLAGSILAPVLLNGDFEMNLALAAVSAVSAWQHRNDWWASRLLAFGFAIAITAFSISQIVSEIQGSRVLVRNFYSSLSIAEFGTGSGRWRRMAHGETVHGAQYLDPGRRSEPLSYYARTSGIALAFERQRELSKGEPLVVGLVGLGAGVIAAYGQSGDRFRFYEINPQVETLARTEFTYLSDTRADVSVIVGDARLVLEGEAAQNFDLLVVDAFSGDSIPMHLLTREATQVYRKHLKPSGALLFHVSNVFVDLRPPLARLALEEQIQARIVSDEPEIDDESDSPVASSHWVIMVADQAWFSRAVRRKAEALPAPHPGPAWTDNFNNILSAIKLSRSDE
jgi:hypothetical protein